MHAVTFQAPGEVRVERAPRPRAAGPRRRDRPHRGHRRVRQRPAHLPRPRRRSSPGFTIGHEYVGTVVAAGDAVSSVAVGDRVLGCFQVACAICRVLPRAATSTSASARGPSAMAPPSATCRARRPSWRSCPTPTSPCAASPTGWPATSRSSPATSWAPASTPAPPVRPGDSVAVLGLGPVGLCAVQAARAAGAAQVIAIDAVPARLDVARGFGAAARPPHRGGPARRREGAPPTGAASTWPSTRWATRARSTSPSASPPAAGRLAWSASTPSAARSTWACVWIKALTLRTGQANVIGHLDRVLALIGAGRARPRPARHPPHEPGRRARGLRALRPPRGAEDRPRALMTSTCPSSTASRTARSWLRGLRFHVAEAGAGDAPVVLVHGWPQHWWMWRHVVPLLAPTSPARDARPARLRLVRRAARGAFDKRPLADDLLAVLDALGLDRGAPDGPRLGRLERLPGLPGGARALRGLSRPRLLRVPAAGPARRQLREVWRFAYQVGDRLAGARPAAGCGPGLRRARDHGGRRATSGVDARRPAGVHRCAGRGGPRAGQRCASTGRSSRARWPAAPRGRLRVPTRDRGRQPATRPSRRRAARRTRATTPTTCASRSWPNAGISCRRSVRAPSPNGREPCSGCVDPEIWPSA